MAKKIKILRIITRLNIGGPAINAVLLTAGFNNENFESLLVTGRIDKAEGDMSYLAKESGIQPIVIPQLGRRLNIYNDFIALWKLFSLVRKEKPDIIHTHTAKAGALGRMSAIIFNLVHKKKIKVVHTFHGHVLSGYFNKISTCFFIFIERLLAGFTGIIIAVSQEVKNDLLALGIGSAEKIRIVPLGLELDKFLNLQLSARQEVNIGIVGRLVPIKNHRMFLDAASLLLNTTRYPLSAIRFFIIGDGELRGDLEGYVQELGIAEKVRFLGWQTDLVKVYENLDIVALTSINEGTPVSLIEALASGCAVIATDVGGVRDLLTSHQSPVTSHQICERGMLVMSTDTYSFAIGLKLLIDDIDLRRRLGEAGRSFVRERFSSKRLIADMEMLYNNLFA